MSPVDTNFTEAADITCIGTNLFKAMDMCVKVRLKDLHQLGIIGILTTLHAVRAYELAGVFDSHVLYNRVFATFWPPAERMMM